jgi:hypothetical protein
MFFFFLFLVGLACMGLEAEVAGALKDTVDGAALAGAAMVTAVPPMAASPIPKAATVLAKRVLITWVPLLEARVTVVVHKRIDGEPQRNLNKHRLIAVWPG